MVRATTGASSDCAPRRFLIHIVRSVVLHQILLEDSIECQNVASLSLKIFFMGRRMFNCDQNSCTRRALNPHLLFSVQRYACTTSAV